MHPPRTSSQARLALQNSTQKGLVESHGMLQSLDYHGSKINLDTTFDGTKNGLRDSYGRH